MGLLVYSRGRWKMLEAEMQPTDVVVFAGVLIRIVTPHNTAPH